MRVGPCLGALAVTASGGGYDVGMMETVGSETRALSASAPWPRKIEARGAGQRWEISPPSSTYTAPVAKSESGEAR
jgi:hypothetical protein